MARGGRRPGAGAPKGNMNALKHGRRSRRFAELGAVIAASPAAREALLSVAARGAEASRQADETAAYVVSEVVRRGLIRGQHRLILSGSQRSGDPDEGSIVLPPTLDGRTINELVNLVAQISGFSAPIINPPTRNTTPNQTSDRDETTENA